MLEQPGQYGTLPMLTRIRAEEVRFRVRAHDPGVMRVLLRGSGVGSSRPIEPKEADLHLLRGRIHVQHTPRDADPSIVMTGREVLEYGAFNDL